MFLKFIKIQQIPLNYSFLIEFTRKSKRYYKLHEIYYVTYWHLYTLFYLYFAVNKPIFFHRALSVTGSRTVLVRSGINLLESRKRYGIRILHVIVIGSWIQVWWSCSCIGFVNHREGGMVFYQVFLLSPLQLCQEISERALSLTLVYTLNYMYLAMC